MAEPTSRRSIVQDPTGQAHAAERGRLSAENPWLWMAPGLLLLLAFSIFPLAYNLFLSFNEWKALKKAFEPKGLENWVELVTNADGRVYNSLEVTLKYTVMAIVIQLILGLVIALLLDAEPWGERIMSSMLILPMVTAPAIAGMMFRLLEHADFGAISWFFYKVGLLDPAEPFLGGSGVYALTGIIIVDVWQWTPFFILIILAGLKGIPTEMLEAAEVDGASWLQRLFRIKLPYLRSVLTIAILFRLIDLYRVFDYIFIMTAGGPGRQTESLSFYAYVNTFQLLRWGYGAALCLAIVAIAWVSVYAYQKIFNVVW